MPPIEFLGFQNCASCCYGGMRETDQAEHDPDCD